MEKSEAEPQQQETMAGNQLDSIMAARTPKPPRKVRVAIWLLGASYFATVARTALMADWVRAAVHRRRGRD